MSVSPTPLLQPAGVSYPYAAVAFKQSLLAEYCSDSSFSQKNQVLTFIRCTCTTADRFQAELAAYIAYAQTEPNGLVYVCVVHGSIQAAHAWDFIGTLKSEWMRRSGNSVVPNPRFGTSEIAAMMRNYNSEGYSKIRTIKDNQRDTQLQETENLQLALARGAQLDVMSQKADEIRESAQTFRHEATNLKNAMLWQKWRWRIFAALVAVVILFVIVWNGCGMKFQRC